MVNFIETDEGETVELSLEVNLIKEGDFIVAYCPSLELSSYGDSEDDAKIAFEEALKIFIDETQSKGTFFNELLNLGWVLQKKPLASFTPPASDVHSLYPHGLLQKSFKEKVSVLV